MLERFEQFSSIISGINRCIQKIETDEMEKYGCKGAYAQYLILLARYRDGLSIARISEMSAIDKAAVSRYITEMESKGLVKREYTQKKYNTKITLTNAGFDAYEFLYGSVLELVKDSGKSLTDSNRQIMYESLDMIYSSLCEISNKQN